MPDCQHLCTDLTQVTKGVICKCGAWWKHGDLTAAMAGNLKLLIFIMAEDPRRPAKPLENYFTPTAPTLAQLNQAGLEVQASDDEPEARSSYEAHRSSRHAA